MACRDGRELRAITGISFRELSSNHRCLSEQAPLKAQAGTSDSRLASRRLQVEKMTMLNYMTDFCACVCIATIYLLEDYYGNYISFILLLFIYLEFNSRDFFLNRC